MALKSLKISFRWILKHDFRERKYFESPVQSTPKHLCSYPWISQGICINTLEQYNLLIDYCLFVMCVIVINLTWSCSTQVMHKWTNWRTEKINISIKPKRYFLGPRLLWKFSHFCDKYGIFCGEIVVAFRHCSLSSAVWGRFYYPFLMFAKRSWFNHHEWLQFNSFANEMCNKLWKFASTQWVELWYVYSR